MMCLMQLNALNENDIIMLSDTAPSLKKYTNTYLSTSNLNKDVPLFIPKVMAEKVPNLG